MTRFVPVVSVTLSAEMSETMSTFWQTSTRLGTLLAPDDIIGDKLGQQERPTNHQEHRYLLHMLITLCLQFSQILLQDQESSPSWIGGIISGTINFCKLELLQKL
jgi:hypothetical protein